MTIIKVGFAAVLIVAGLTVMAQAKTVVGSIAVSHSSSDCMRMGLTEANACFNKVEAQLKADAPALQAIAR